MHDTVVSKHVRLGNQCVIDRVPIHCLRNAEDFICQGNERLPVEQITAFVDVLNDVLLHNVIHELRGKQRIHIGKTIVSSKVDQGFIRRSKDGKWTWSVFIVIQDGLAAEVILESCIEHCLFKEGVIVALHDHIPSRCAWISGRG